MDGKTLRHSFDRAGSKGAVHIILAWSSRQRLILGQRQVDDKSKKNKRPVGHEQANTDPGILPLASLLVVTLGEIRLIFIGFGMRYIHFNTPVVVLAHPWAVAAPSSGGLAKLHY